MHHLPHVADVAHLQLVSRRSWRQLVQVFDSVDGGWAGPGVAAAGGCGDDHKSWPGKEEEFHHEKHVDQNIAEDGPCGHLGEVFAAAHQYHHALEETVPPGQILGYSGVQPLAEGEHVLAAEPQVVVGE